MDQEFELKQMVLYCGSFGPAEVDQILGILNRDYKKIDELKEGIAELVTKQDELSPSMMVKLGVCQFLIGEYDAAEETLKKGDGGAMAQYYFAKIAMAKKDYKKAIDAFNIARKAGYNGDICALGRAEAYREMKDLENSLKELDQLSGAIEQTADYLYQRGATIAATGENPRETVALYERAIAVDHNHPGALFGLALENERRGNDQEALELYKRAVAHFPTNVGTLMNLGVLYEDMEMYDQAVVCFQRVLDAFPEDKQAAMFLKDAKASSERSIDDASRKKDLGSPDLNTPVSDFELSVRSRNCLKNMGIFTLGDLCRHTEQELLASKNFGETSLIEIREILKMKGLELGMFAAEAKSEVKEEPYELDTGDDQGLLNRPVTDLNLSVRARKCLNRKNIKTIGELVRMTQEELLDCKNFGVTSLNEIREKLQNFNLKLRGE